LVEKNNTAETRGRSLVVVVVVLSDDHFDESKEYEERPAGCALKTEGPIKYVRTRASIASQSRVQSREVDHTHVHNTHHITIPEGNRVKISKSKNSLNVMLCRYLGYNDEPATQQVIGIL